MGVSVLSGLFVSTDQSGGSRHSAGQVQALDLLAPGGRFPVTVWVGTPGPSDRDAQQHLITLCAGLYGFLGSAPADLRGGAEGEAQAAPLRARAPIL